MVGVVELRTLPKSVAGIVERVQLIIGHQRVANGAQDVQVLPIVVAVVVVATIAIVVVVATAANATVVGAVAASWTIIVRTEASLKRQREIGGKKRIDGEKERMGERDKEEGERERHQDVFS